MSADDRQHGDPWDRMKADLESQEQGRLILAEFARSEDQAVDRLITWLTEKHDGATHSTVQVYGGSINQLISIARVEALHIYGKTPDPPVPRQVPASIADFTDRAAELARLCASLRTPPRDATCIHTISGKAGVGKTTFAVRAARECAASYPDGQLYCELTGSQGRPRDPEELLFEFLRDIGVAPDVIPEGRTNRERLYRSRTAGKKLLVLLDNAWEESEVTPLIPAGPQSSVVVTSRRFLLGLDGAQRHHLTELEAPDAVEMLAQVAGVDRVADAPADAEAIATACGFLPLALRIAGSRVAVVPQRPLVWFAKRLNNEHQRLRELHSGNRDVRAAFMVSYGNLESAAQRLFRLLARVEIKTFSSWVAAALLDLPEAEAEALLDSLADQAMIELAYSDEAGQSRYRFHDLLRLFGQEQSHEDDNVIESLDRVFSMACGLAGWHTLRIMPDSYVAAAREPVLTSWIERAGTSQASTANAEEWLTAEQSTLLQLARQSHLAQRDHIAWRFTFTLQDYVEIAGLLTSWKELSELAVISARRLGDHVSEAYAFRCLGVVEGYQGSGQASLDHLLTALEHAGHVNDDMLTATILRSLGEASGMLGDNTRMTSWCTEAYHLFESLSKPVWAAWTLWSQGALGQYSRSEQTEYLMASMRMFEESGDTRGMAIALRSIGELHVREGNTELALHYLEQCLPLFRSMNDRSGVALTMSRLGEMYRSQGRTTLAQEYMNASAPFIADLGPHGGML